MDSLGQYLSNVQSVKAIILVTANKVLGFSLFPEYVAFVYGLLSQNG